MPGIEIHDEDWIMQRLLLAEAINSLSLKQRVVVAMRAAGYTQKEVGIVIGTTRSAVGFIHKKAVQRIKDFLTEGD